MHWFRRQRSRAAGTLDREADNTDRRHLEDFARSRRGVEAYVEPPTAMTSATVVLVAHDGEWTRRRVRDGRSGHELARKLGIPAYDAALMGYPQRMWDWNARKGEA